MIKEVTGTPPIYVAAGIAVQSQWQEDAIDGIEPIYQNTDNPSLGIAQLQPSEVDGDPLDPAVAAQGMADKIGHAMAICSDCSPTDLAIIAGMAQNGIGDDTLRDVIAGYSDYDEETGVRTIRWDDWFATLESPAEEKSDARWPLFEERTQGRPWEQFQVQLFTNNLRAFVAGGWELPEGVDLDYMDCVANSTGPGQCSR